MSTPLHATDCAFCGTPILARPGQRFCQDSCRVQASQKKRAAAYGALVALAGPYGFTEGHAVEFVSYHGLARVEALLGRFGMTYDDGRRVWTRRAVGG